MKTSDIVNRFFTPDTPPLKMPPKAAEIMELSKDQVVQSHKELQDAINNLELSHPHVVADTIDKGELLMEANEVQVGGDHYKKQTIQPWDAITAWKLGFLDGNAVKYLARWKTKNGLQDLRKAQHYITKLIEEEKARLVSAGLPVPSPSTPDMEASTPAEPEADPVEPEADPEDEGVAMMAERLSREQNAPHPRDQNPPKPVQMKTRQKIKSKT